MAYESYLPLYMSVKSSQSKISLDSDTTLAAPTSSASASVRTRKASVDEAAAEDLYSVLEEFSPCGPDGCELPPRYAQNDSPPVNVNVHLNYAQDPRRHFHPYSSQEPFATNQISQYVLQQSPQYRPASPMGLPMSPPRQPLDIRQYGDIVSLRQQLDQLSMRVDLPTMVVRQQLEMGRGNVDPRIVDPRPMSPHEYQRNLPSRPNFRPHYVQYGQPTATYNHNTDQADYIAIQRENSSYGYRPITPDLVRSHSLDVERRIQYEMVDDHSSINSGVSGDSDDVNMTLAKLGGNALDFTEHEKPTLFELLKPYVPDSGEINEEFKSFQAISGWMIGSPENCLNHFALWKPAAKGYQFALARMFSIPKIDFKLAAITPRLRRSILLVSSMQYRCHYCAAHAAGVGELLKGSWRSQVALKVETNVLSEQSMGKKRNASRPEARSELIKPIIDPMDKRINFKESDVLRLVTAASRIPSKVTPELKKNVIEGIGEEGLQI
ncbi:hypothetical protein HK096_008411, partial [Nowakowskiella sp. JEL0078]